MCIDFVLPFSRTRQAKQTKNATGKDRITGIQDLLITGLLPSCNSVCSSISLRKTIICLPIMIVYVVDIPRKPPKSLVFNLADTLG